MNNGRPLIVKSYLSSLPARINGEEKINALTYFAEGVARCGDQVEVTRSQVYEPCDVGAIIGNAFDANPGKVNLPHYKVRKMVMEQQRQRGRYWLSIDSNVFIYRDRTNPHKYLRYSFNGVTRKQNKAPLIAQRVLENWEHHYYQVLILSQMRLILWII